MVESQMDHRHIVVKHVENVVRMNIVIEDQTPQIRSVARDMLINCSGIREISRVFDICTYCVLGLLVSFKDLCWIPQHTHYHQVEVDEVYSLVQNKNKKVWILYAYCKKSRKILAVTLGKRSRKTVR